MSYDDNDNSIQESKKELLKELKGLIKDDKLDDLISFLEEEKNDLFKDDEEYSKQIIKMVNDYFVKKLKVLEEYKNKCKSLKNYDNQNLVIKNEVDKAILASHKISKICKSIINNINLGSGELLNYENSVTIDNLIKFLKIEKGNILKINKILRKNKCDIGTFVSKKLEELLDKDEILEAGAYLNTVIDDKYVDSIKSVIIEWMKKQIVYLDNSIESCSYESDVSNYKKNKSIQVKEFFETKIKEINNITKIDYLTDFFGKFSNNYYTEKKQYMFECSKIGYDAVSGIKDYDPKPSLSDDPGYAFSLYTDIPNDTSVSSNIPDIPGDTEISPDIPGDTEITDESSQEVAYVIIKLLEKNKVNDAIKKIKLMKSLIDLDIIIKMIGDWIDSRKDSTDNKIALCTQYKVDANEKYRDSNNDIITNEVTKYTNINNKYIDKLSTPNERIYSGFVDVISNPTVENLLRFLENNKKNIILINNEHNKKGCNDTEFLSTIIGSKITSWDNMVKRNNKISDNLALYEKSYRDNIYKAYNKTIGSNLSRRGINLSDTTVAAASGVGVIAALAGGSTIILIIITIILSITVFIYAVRSSKKDRTN